MNTENCWQVKGDFNIRFHHSVMALHNVRIRKPFNKAIVRVFLSLNDSDSKSPEQADLSFPDDEIVEIVDSNDCVVWSP